MGEAVLGSGMGRKVIMSRLSNLLSSPIGELASVVALNRLWTRYAYQLRLTGISYLARR